MGKRDEWSKVIIAFGLICYKKFCLIGMWIGKKTTVEAGALRLPVGRWAGRGSDFLLSCFVLWKHFCVVLYLEIMLRLCCKRDLAKRGRG